MSLPDLLTAPPSKPVGGMPDTVFDRIALSLSGGGFRASAYSLGTLNTLYLLGLLDHVQMLSTASGGTLTGAFYALRCKQGDSFETIYDDAYQWLAQDTLLPDAVSHWQQCIGSRGSNYKLIRAFADVYDRTFYNGATLAEFWKPDPVPAKPFHLQSIIFGATELYSGLTFRFQYASFIPAQYHDRDEGQRDGYFVGNGNVHIDLAHAQKLRLGDMVAASSCFPGGFEPVVMPDDFFSDGSAKPVLLDRNRQPLHQQRVALVDGGVYDNQGTESLLAANRRNQAYCQSPNFGSSQLSSAARDLLKPFTLLVMADVDSAGKNLYQAPGPPPAARQSPSLGQLEQWLQGGLLVGGIVLVLAFWLSGRGYGNFGAGLLAGFLMPVLALLLLVRWGWGRLKTILANFDQTIFTMALPSFMQLSLRQWGYLLLARLSSLFALLNSVFLRRVRSLTYSQLYSQGPDGTFEVLPSIIGGIVTDAERPHQPNPNRPSVRDQVAGVVQTVREASEMPTTLWWQENKTLFPKIVASAEITLCYRLLLQFEKRPPTGSLGTTVQQRAQLIWNAYQQHTPGFRLHPALLTLLQDEACTASQLVAEAARLTTRFNPAPPKSPGHS